MKLYSEKAELVAIRTICSGRDQKNAAALLAFLTADHFHHPYLKEGFKRLQKSSKASGEIMSYSELVLDPKLNEQARSFLNKKLKTVKPVGSEEVKKIRSTLFKYFQIRTVYEVSKNALNHLDGDSVDSAELMDSMSEALAKARNTGTAEDMLYHFGRGSNTKALQERIIEGKLPPLIRTGFKTYDEQCGGIREKSVVILTANTGGLKSTVALNMATNMYCNGNNTALGSFEMDEDEVAIRFASARCRIPMSKILAGELTAKEKKTLKAAFEEFEAVGKGKKCRFTVLSATDSDLGIDQTLATLAPFGYKIIFIDYVSLLADADSDEQWKALSRVARKCKLFAKRNNCIIVLLAQLSDDDKIRYSKGIAEHADMWWRWRIGDSERETGIFTIHQAKARHGRIFSWEQGVEFETNNIYNLDADAFTSRKSDSKKFSVTDDDEKDGKTKKSKGKEKINRSSIEEIDSDDEAVAELFEDD